jgi:hypothetical protein
VVKGLSKRAVTVRFPDSHVFEQAIFMVREDRKTRGVSAGDVLREACAIAERHAQISPPVYARSKRTKLLLWPPAVFIAIGCGLMGLVWLIASLI